MVSPPRDIPTHPPLTAEPESGCLRFSPNGCRAALASAQARPDSLTRTHARARGGGWSLSTPRTRDRAGKAMGEAETPSFEMTWSSTSSSGYCSQEDSDSELEQYFTARTSLVRRPRRDQVGAPGVPPAGEGRSLEPRPCPVSCGLES